MFKLRFNESNSNSEKYEVDVILDNAVYVKELDGKSYLLGL